MSKERVEKEKELLNETVDEVDDALISLLVSDGYKKFETRRKCIRQAIEAIDRYVSR